MVSKSHNEPSLKEGITEETEKKYGSKPVTVVLIHASWCGHCKNLMPHWKQIKEEFDNSPHIDLVEIESADNNKEEVINDLNSIINGNEKVKENGYPSIYGIKGGTLMENKNDRTFDGLKTWINSMLKPAYKKGGRKSRRRKTKKQLRRRKTIKN